MARTNGRITPPRNAAAAKAGAANGAKRGNGNGTTNGAKRANGSTFADAPGFDAGVFVRTIGAGRTRAVHKANTAIFQQGDPCACVFYIEKGKVQITVVSKQGKKGVVATLGPGEFFGEGCLGGQRRHLTSAHAMVASTITSIEKATMVRTLHEQPTFSALFMGFLLARNIEIESDLIDELFNSTERRLARMLLVLARFGRPGKLAAVIPKIDHDVLAGRIGTTRTRIGYFMARFRKLGLIAYDAGGIKVNPSLLRVVVHD
ncbi:MAG: Crp/Fnr family transcriptional regulator [Rhodospirillales bacterium]|nr:Crp/Fnr family transcriptional regulator [Rhodospirillales bacterium]